MANIAKIYTIKEAEEQGYTVDTSTYPHLGYKGERFTPKDTVMVYSRLEDELITKLAKIQGVINDWR